MKTLYKLLASLAVACLMASFDCVVPTQSLADDDDARIIPDLVITPSTLNMKSRGKFVTAHVRLPGKYETLNAEDVKLHLVVDDNDTGEVEAVRIGSDIFDRTLIKFYRREVQDLIGATVEKFPAVVTLSITFDIDNETLRYTDDIQVIKPGKGKGGNGGN